MYQVEGGRRDKLRDWGKGHRTRAVRSIAHVGLADTPSYMSLSIPVDAALVQTSVTDASFERWKLFELWNLLSRF